MFRLWNTLIGEAPELPAAPGGGSGPGGEESFEGDLLVQAGDCCRFAGDCCRFAGDCCRYAVGAGFVRLGVASGPALT